MAAKTDTSIAIIATIQTVGAGALSFGAGTYGVYALNGALYAGSCMASADCTSAGGVALLAGACALAGASMRFIAKVVARYVTAPAEGVTLTPDQAARVADLDQFIAADLSRVQRYPFWASPANFVVSAIFDAFGPAASAVVAACGLPAALRARGAAIDRGMIVRDAARAQLENEQQGDRIAA